MRAEVILNGTMKIVVIPENDIETSILTAMGKESVDICFQDKGTAILDKIIPDCAIISVVKKQ